MLTFYDLPSFCDLADWSLLCGVLLMCLDLHKRISRLFSKGVFQRRYSRGVEVLLSVDMGEKIVVM